MHSRSRERWRKPWLITTKPWSFSPLAKAHYNLGNALIKQGKVVEAIGEYRIAVKLRPEDLSMNINLANAIFTLGHLDEAIAQYRQALSIAPDDARVNKNLGRLLLLKGDFDNAMPCFQKAMPMSLQPVEKRFTSATTCLKVVITNKPSTAIGRPYRSSPALPTLRPISGSLSYRKGKPGMPLIAGNRPSPSNRTCRKSRTDWHGRWLRHLMNPCGTAQKLLFWPSGQIN